MVFMEQHQTSYNTLEEYAGFSLFVSHIIELVEASCDIIRPTKFVP